MSASLGGPDSVSAMRDAWLDNVKMTLVTVVVIGHSVVLAPSDARNDHIYDFIYAWHIPAFVLVTGYLSRSFRWTRRHLVSLLTTIAVPYVIFEIAMFEFRTRVGGEAIDGTPLINPHWPVWYLAAVFLWRLAAPALGRHWLAIPVSVAASLAFGATDGETVLDLNRVIGLLPFFVIGLHLSPGLLARLKTPPARVAGAAAMVGIWLATAHTDDWIPHPATYSATKWLWYSQPYEVFGVDTGAGMVTRLCLIAVSVVGSLGAMALVPRARSSYTAMGAASLVVYLFHGFVVRSLEYAGYPEWAARQGSWTIWPTMAGAVCLALILAWPPVARRLGVLTDPIGTARRRR